MEKVGRNHSDRIASVKKRNGIIKNTYNPPGMTINGFLTAAEDGDLKAQHQLALIYILGEAVPRNLVEAEKWLRKASEAGHLPSKRELGILIASGSIEGKHESEAYDLLRGPIDRLDPRSVYYLALMYENGKGVEKDIVNSMRLYGIAASLGYPGAEEDYSRVVGAYTEERHALLRSRPLLDLEVSESGIEAACCKDMLDLIITGDIFFIDSYKGPAIGAMDEDGRDVMLKACPFCDTPVRTVEKES